MIRFEQIQDLENARKWWHHFSPGEMLYDEWEFRWLFYKQEEYPLHFFLGFENDEPIGLLPLQKNTDKNWYEFFGGQYMENNQIYVKPGYEEARREFYKLLHEKTNLEYLIGDDSATKALPVMDEKFFLPLSDLQSLEDYFQKYFDGEGRGKMRRKMRHIENENIHIIKNHFEDIEQFFQFNIANFQESSTFHLKGRKESFREILSFKHPIYLLSFYKENELLGVSLAVIGHDKTYEYLNLGVNTSAPRDMKSYIHLKNIETALEAGAQVFNAGCSDCGWKGLFHLERSPQYQFRLPSE